MTGGRHPNPRFCDIATRRGSALPGGLPGIPRASAYPASRFVGVDAHPASIEVARQRAVEARVADRVRFEVAEATDYNGGPFDVIWFFDALHDLGDPTAAAAWAREHLTEDGLFALVEPFAEDDRAGNIATNPVAGLHYTASTFLCVPHALSEPGQATLGAQAGGQVLADVLKAGGFTRVDQVATTPIHAVFAAMP